MLGSFNNCNTIPFSNKITTNKDFDAVHKVVPDGIRDNMSAVFHNVKYGAINTSDPTTMGYYVVKILSELYMLQDKKTVDKQVIQASELILKS